MHSLKELTESVTEKAEKTEVSELRVSIVNKHEFTALLAKCSLLDRNFQQQLVLFIETLRSLLRSSESPVKRNKDRQEILRNIENLLMFHNRSQGGTPPPKTRGNHNCCLRTHRATKSALHTPINLK